MKHRKGQNVTDIVAALAAASLFSAGFSVMLQGRALADHPEEPGVLLPHVMELCDSEDGWDQEEFPCMWDAEHMGNGMGSSYILRVSGEPDRVTHKRAHRVWLAHQ